MTGVDFEQNFSRTTNISFVLLPTKQHIHNVSTFIFREQGLHIQRCNYYIKVTRWPSNLRQNTRECVHLVTSAHFRSRDEDDGHTIRSDIAENPMLHTNFMTLFYGTAVIDERRPELEKP